MKLARQLNVKLLVVLAVGMTISGVAWVLLGLNDPSTGNFLLSCVFLVLSCIVLILALWELAKRRGTGLQRG